MTAGFMLSFTNRRWEDNQLTYQLMWAGVDWVWLCDLPELSLYDKTNEEQKPNVLVLLCVWMFSLNSVFFTDLYILTSEISFAVSTLWYCGVIWCKWYIVFVFQQQIFPFCIDEQIYACLPCWGGFDEHEEASGLLSQQRRRRGCQKKHRGLETLHKHLSAWIFLKYLALEEPNLLTETLWDHPAAVTGALGWRLSKLIRCIHLQKETFNPHLRFTKIQQTIQYCTTEMCLSVWQYITVC